MSASPPPSSGASFDEEFVPVYTSPAWYLEERPVQDADPWWSVQPTPPFSPPGCQICGVKSVADVTVRAHQGLIIVMRWQRIDGPLCGYCGVALIRDLTTRTLWQGWWSVGSLIIGAPFALLSNFFAYRKLSRLQLAVPTDGRGQAPLGKPILRRPLAYVALIPLCSAIWLIAGAVASMT
ncbi:hypothetical protein [Streptomyces olivaceoviridis]|uniref:hypothetical protein n=1 Tax=Streptomyces olivaceoviridis TaxID=1921 RepID=UPI003316E043